MYYLCITMEIKEIQTPEKRTKIISMRTYPSYSKWMRENKIRPSALFNKAIQELIEKQKV